MNNSRICKCGCDINFAIKNGMCDSCTAIIIKMFNDGRSAAQENLPYDINQNEYWQQGWRIFDCERRAKEIADLKGELDKYKKFTVSDSTIEALADRLLNDEDKIALHAVANTIFNLKGELSIVKVEKDNTEKIAAMYEAESEKFQAEAKLWKLRTDEAAEVVGKLEEENERLNMIINNLKLETDLLRYRFDGQQSPKGAK